MDNITIKLQLLNGQLRRFIVPRNSTFEQFTSIISQVAPHARKSLFSYEDDEGDQITISTDIELQEAINNIKLNNCLKLNEKERIKHFKKQQQLSPQPQSPIIENRINMNSNEQVEKQQQQPIQVERKLVKPTIVLTLKVNHENNDNKHHNVICDGCECSPIIGIRYRKIGSDYDLCSNCWNKVEQIQQIQSKPVECKAFFSRHHLKYSAWLGDCHQFIEIQTPINGLTPIEFCVQKIIRKADRQAHKFRSFNQLNKFNYNNDDNNNNHFPHHPHHFPHHPHHFPHHRHHFHNRCRFPFPPPPHFAHPPMNTDNNDTTNNTTNNNNEQFFARRPYCNRFARFNERFINKFEKAYENENKNDSTNSDDKMNVENNEQSSIPMPIPIPISNESVEIENNNDNNNVNSNDKLEVDENKKALLLLEEMGFADNQLNQSLLTQYLGDINVVIDTLQKLTFN